MKALCFKKDFACVMEEKLARDLKYNQESFWLRIVDLRENFNDEKFTNLFEVNAKVDKIYNMALENSMEQTVIQEWQQHVLTVSSLWMASGASPIIQH